MSNLPFQFGEKVGFISMTHPATLAGVGGATAGAVSGLISPGEYEDEDGNVKKRSRIGSALRRALMLGAGGVGAGLTYDYFSRPNAAKYDPVTRKPIAGEGAKLHEQLDSPNPFLATRDLENLPLVRMPRVGRNTGDIENLPIPQREGLTPEMPYTHYKPKTK